jgi:sulfotransferase family protein
MKEPTYFASEIRWEHFSDALRPRAEQSRDQLRTYLDGPMREKRFGGPVTEWSDYLKLFRDAGARKAIGEASVCYLWSESAATNIRRSIPGARIILVLRNPVDMAFSMYWHTVRSLETHHTFREAIEMGLQQRGGKLDLWHPFLDMGLYYRQVKRYLETFSEERVRVYWYDEYQAEPALMLADIFRFLDVDPAFSPDMSKRYLEAGTLEVINPADRAFLIEFYRDDVGKLADLLGRNLSSWLT